MTITVKPEAEASANGWLDFGAIALSGLCLVHCVALPVLAGLLPVLGTGWLADERMHLWLLVAVVPTSLLAFGLGFRTHRRFGLVAWGVLALCGVSFAALARQYGLIDESGDRWITVCSGLLLSVAHIGNYRLMHRGHQH